MMSEEKQEEATHRVTYRKSTGIFRPTLVRQIIMIVLQVINYVLVQGMTR